MGSKGLWAFIQPIMKRVSLDKLKNKRLIIDIILYLHKQIIGIRNKGIDLVNKRGKNINHLVSLYNIIKNIVACNILPICIFDGKAPTLKKQTINKRKDNIIKSKKIIEHIHKEINIMNENLFYDESQANSENNDSGIDSETIDSNEYTDIEQEQINYGIKLELEYLKHFKKSFNISTSEIDECKNLLTLMGIPYITSFEEADKESADLYNKYKDFIDGIMTEDSDIMLFGGGCVYKDIDFNHGTAYEINIDEVLSYLQEKALLINPDITFTLNNLIEFSIILGNDYTNGIRINSMIEKYYKLNKNISNLSNMREILFIEYISSDCNIDKLLEKLYKINVINDTILYYIPTNFKEIFMLTKEIYQKNSYNTYTYDNIVMKKPKNDLLNSYLINNEITKRYNINTLIRNLNKLYEEFKKIKIINKPIIRKFNTKENIIDNDVNDNDNDNDEGEWIQVVRYKNKICL
jgi:5'-3' exonuclease